MLKRPVLLLVRALSRRVHQQHSVEADRLFLNSMAGDIRATDSYLNPVVECFATLVRQAVNDDGSPRVFF